MKNRSLILNQRVLAIAAIISLTCLAGCNKRVTIETWQQTLTRYANEQSNHDLNFIRDYGTQSSPDFRAGSPPGSESRATFTVLGGKSPDSSTDVTGVLLGRRIVDGQHSYVFLVGVVAQRTVEDIRIGLLADDEDHPQWKFSRADPNALTLYKSCKDQAWRTRHPGRSQPPVDALNFPSEDDVFKLRVTGDGVLVTEQRSGAQWTLAYQGGRKLSDALGYYEEEFDEE